MLRKIGALVAGMVVVAGVVFVLQAMSAALHPLPEGLDPMDESDAEALSAHLAAMPPLSWALAFSSELIGAFLGALAAGWIARPRPSTTDLSGFVERRTVRVASGVIVGFATIASVYNWTLFPHPNWFIVGQLVGYPLVLIAAWALLGRRASAIAPGR